MKKNYILLLCFVATSLSAVIMEDRPHPLTINGKSFGNAVMINGNLMVSLPDVAHGLNGTPNLGPTLQVQGNRLIGLLLPSPSAQADTFGSARPGSAVQNKAFQVRKAGEISSHLLTLNGKTYVPLTDLARNGFGARSWTAPTTLTTGQALSLNFAVNGDGIIALGH